MTEVRLFRYPNTNPDVEGDIAKDLDSLSGAIMSMSMTETPAHLTILYVIAHPEKRPDIAVVQPNQIKIIGDPK